MHCRRLAEKLCRNLLPRQHGRNIEGVPRRWSVDERILSGEVLDGPPRLRYLGHQAVSHRGARRPEKVFYSFQVVEQDTIVGLTPKFALNLRQMVPQHALSTGTVLFVQYGQDRPHHVRDVVSHARGDFQSYLVFVDLKEWRRLSDRRGVLLPCIGGRFSGQGCCLGSSSGRCLQVFPPENQHILFLL